MVMSFMTQYNAALAMTGAIRGTNTERFYEELGSEFLQNRRQLRRLCLFYKICKDHTAPYLHNLILTNFQSSYSLRVIKEIPLSRVKYTFMEKIHDVEILILDL